MDNTIKAGGTGLRSYEDYLEAVKNAERKPVQNLGKSEFLTLLSAQMQYQDPLEPTKDTDFIAQLSQFSSLDQITALTNSTTMFQYYSLAGKYVYANVRLDTGENAAVSGLVDRVVNKDGVAWAQIGDYLVEASKITEVYDNTLFGDLNANTLLGSSNLIGRTVTAKMVVTPASGATPAVFEDITGVVSGVHTDEKGQNLATITKEDGTEVDVHVGNIVRITV